MAFFGQTQLWSVRMKMKETSPNELQSSNPKPAAVPSQWQAFTCVNIYVLGVPTSNAVMVESAPEKQAE